jgi:2-(1,2-epoxy-1,2-dihydrophenyl)acetyl-CoA isomerase
MGATESEALVLFEREKGLAVLTLNRPASYNALDLELGEALLAAAIRCDEDPAVRAVLITGAGPAFCSGGDIRQMCEEAEPDGRAGAFLKRLTVRFHATIATLARMPKPVVMAVNGPAAGGGLSLALAGDLVVASEDASFTLGYTAIGLAPDGSSSFTLPRLVGPKRAYELMALNRKLTAAEARDLGLINQVFPAERFRDEALDYARRLAQGPTRALGQAKKLLLLNATCDLETAMEHERRAIAACGGTNDFIEGVGAFFDKRKAAFRGD